MKQGRVIINRNICDNDPACSGIAVCPSGALYWDEEKEQIEYDATRCIDCGCCADPEMDGCPVGAIMWGVDDRDYEEKERLVQEETRTLEQLEVERYGAVPIKPVLSYDDIYGLLQSNRDKYVIIEFFNDDSINCLVHSIRVEDILLHFNGETIYKKVPIDTTEDCSGLCTIEELPALCIFKNAECIGVVNGYYENSEDDSNELFGKIKSVLES